MSYIALDDCSHRWLYLVKCRNFQLGVFNKDFDCFIGIREKFGNEFLFPEYHWDTGEPFGTAQPYGPLEELPSDIEINTSLGIKDENTGEFVVFVKNSGWKFVRTGGYSTNITPVSVPNDKLFNWLKDKKSVYIG